MHPTPSFWTLIDELAPNLPLGGDITWTVSLETVMRWLHSQGLRIPETSVESALESAADWNPGWPWTVQRRGTSFAFSPRFW